MYIKVKRGRLLWHYVIVGGNGQTLSTSETYYSKGNADKAAKILAEALSLKVKE